jgi:uncharacterized protein
MNAARIARAAPLAGVLLLLGACGHGPPVRWLTLDPVAPASPAYAYAGPPVVVVAVHIPPDLDRLEVAREVAPDQLEVDDFTRWAAAPGELCLGALAVDLAARLPAGAVVVPRAPTPQGAQRLTVEIVALRVGGGQATMDASWTLTTQGGLVRRTERLTTPSAGHDSAAVAAALASLLAQLGDRIAAGLPTGATDKG